MDECVLLEPRDFVFHGELAPFEPGVFQAVRRWMRESVGNFHFECPVPSFKFCKMRFDRHLAILLASIDLTRNPSTRKRLTLTRPIYSFLPRGENTRCALSLHRTCGILAKTR